MRRKYLVLKLCFVKGCGYESYISKENQKEQKEEATADEEPTVEEKQEATVPLVTHVNNILHSIFSNIEVYINNQQIYNLNGLYVNKS